MLVILLFIMLTFVESKSTLLIGWFYYNCLQANSHKFQAITVDLDILYRKPRVYCWNCTMLCRCILVFVKVFGFFFHSRKPHISQDLLISRLEKSLLNYLSKSGRHWKYILAIRQYLNMLFLFFCNNSFIISQNLLVCNLIFH